MNKNIWLCSDYSYQRYDKPKTLPSIHPERADKLRMYGMAGGMTLVAEHLLRHTDGTPAYIAYEWIDWHGSSSAYITMELIPNDMIVSGYYMRVAGVSNDAWLLDRLMYDTDGEAIGLHNPTDRSGTKLWTARPTLDGIL